MSLLAWIIVGLVAGFLAKTVMPVSSGEPSGFLGTMLLGIVGAVVGGWVWNIVLGRSGATGVDIGSIFVAFIGAIIVLGLLRVFNRHGVA